MRFSSYIGASAAIALASAQTFTECNPTQKQCPNNPAIAATFETNFKAGKDAVKGWKQTAGSLKYSASGADFVLAKKGDAPTIQTEGYLQFGYIEVKAKAAPGKGVVSSIVLQSEDLDEVDWEFIGGVGDKVQMNYFGKGNTTTYDRMIEAPVANTQGEFHTYALNWTAESLVWLIDQKPVRTLKFAEANGGNNYPQTPSTVRIGIWAGGDPGNNKGTIEWAGGEIDYGKAPYTMSVESVKIINYSPGLEYKWTDKSGKYQSIEVIEPGKKDGAPVNSAIPIASATVTGGTPGKVDVPTPTAAASNKDGYNAPKPSGSKACGTTTVTVTLPPGGSPPPPPATSAPPPASSTSPPKIQTDTNPPPTPSGGYTPPRNSTTSSSPPPPVFTGAASHNQVGALVGLMAGAAMLFV